MAVAVNAYRSGAMTGAAPGDPSHGWIGRERWVRRDRSMLGPFLSRWRMIFSENRFPLFRIMR
jgi:hypothetical protein